MITIRSPHVVTVTANVTIDQTVVDAGGTMTVDAGVNVTLANGTGTEIALNGTMNLSGTITFGGIPNRTMVVAGTLNNQGTLSGATVLKLSFLSGASYNHLFTTGGTIPLATWDANSTMSVTGFTTGVLVAPTNLNQSFGIFVWNCPGQASDDGFLSLGGFPVSVTGDFRIVDTGGDALYHSLGAGGTLNIGDDLEVTGGTFAFVSGTSGTLAISGDIDISGTGYIQFADDQDLTMTCNGNFILNTDGQVDFAATTAVTTFNLKGNYTQTGGSLFTSGGVSNFVFNGTTPQIYTSTLTPIGGTINYNIANGASVSLATDNFFGGAGSFTLSDGATLQVGSTAVAGAIQTGPFNGNIRVTGTRTFASGSTIIYNGAAAQFIGLGHPGTTGVTTQINNTNGVSLASDVTFGGPLTLTNGNLSVLNRTLTIGGDLTMNSNSIAVLPTSNIAITGNGSFGAGNPNGILNLTGTAPLTINNFTLNRTNGRVWVFDDFKINGVFTQSQGDLDIRGFLLTLSGPVSITGGTLIVNEYARLQVDGTGTMTGNVNFVNEGGSPMLAINMNRPAETLSVGSALDLTQLNLTAGAFSPSPTFRMATAGTITRAAGTITTAPGAVSAYNVIYNTSSNISTGPELPYNPNDTRLTDVTNLGTGIISLSQPTTINGTLTLSNGTFNAGSNAVIFRGNIVSNAGGTFTSSPVKFDGTSVVSGSIPLNLGAFEVNLNHTLNLGTGTTVNIAGNVTNNGKIYGGTSTAVFNGNTTLTNTTDVLLLGNFNNVQVTGALTLDLADFLEPVPDSALYRIQVAGTWNVSGGTFTPGISRVDFVGTNQTITSGGQPFYSVYVLGTGTTTLGQAMTVVNDLKIGSTSTLDASTNNYQISIAEDFVTDGTFVARQGKVLFNGIGTIQSITRTTGSGPVGLYNLEVSKSGTPNPLNILTPVDVQHFVTVSTAHTINAGTNQLRLLSNAAFTARVTQLATGASITGSVIVQRYMPNTSGSVSYRYLSAPVTGSTVTDWRTEIPITAIYWYDETNYTAGPSLEARYRSYALTGALTQGRGYAANVNTAGVATFDSRGTLGQGAVPVPVTAHSAGGNDGWNLIGNPYPSAINWNNVTIPTGLNNAIYISDNFNNSGQGTGLKYVSYVNGVPSVQGYAGLIAQGQAFWVRATANATVTFQEDDKDNGAAQFFREEDIPNLLRIAMKGQSLEDETVLRLHAPATDSFDPQYDAYKLLNSKLSLSTITTDNLSLSINSMGALDCDKKIPLAMVGAVKGTYQMSFTGLPSFSANMNLYLVDQLQNTTVNLRDASTYSFTVSATDLPNLSKRFYLTVGKASVKTDLTVSGESTCATNSFANVTLEQSQADVLYAIQYKDQVTDYFKGTGNVLSIPVSTALLAAGENEVIVLAKASSCVTMPLQTKPVIKIVSKGVVSRVEEGNVCQSGAATLTAEGASADGWYNWYEDITDTAPIAGQQGASFETPVINKTKTYYVSAVNAMGCEGDRIAVKANVAQVEPVTVTGAGTTLTSSYATGNQWLRNGAVITGATTNKFEVTETGVYTVEVTVGDCKTTSTAREVTITANETGVNGNDAVSIYPNPTVRKVLVRVSSTNKDVKATLIDAAGVEVDAHSLKGESGVKEAEFDLGNRAIGVYYLLIVDGQKRFTEKIVKIK
ncbi:T9SS type A sorting domain-containing protein [Chryseolinea lacunae]|uniref:T9SS type A sorting domain-containing protein n=1 Tax=Chryseolinea lacunae TaxID=2801331 RepID=A0ABS1KWZ4_9BACT|nr:T9SS type A sorting domain-containing protein [Chryseolinea lacunae]MBL0743855.1 T9SS type A sorting domain-containing protein [Chryseolinea lacunae]